MEGFTKEGALQEGVATENAPQESVTEEGVEQDSGKQDGAAQHCGQQDDAAQEDVEQEGATQEGGQLAPIPKLRSPRLASYWGYRPSHAMSHSCWQWLGLRHMRPQK